MSEVVRKADDVIDAIGLRARVEHALQTQTPEMGRFFLARFLGFEFGYADETCTIRFEARDYMLNPQGSLHGGVIATALDTAMGHLVAHLYAKGATVEMKTQYLSAVRAGPCRVVATVLRKGRRLWFVQSSFFNAADQLAAFSTATWSVPVAGNAMSGPPSN